MIRLGRSARTSCWWIRKGVVYKGRTEGMNKYKERFALDTDRRTLADAVRGTDVFYGLSMQGCAHPRDGQDDGRAAR